MSPWPPDMLATAVSMSGGQSARYSKSFAVFVRNESSGLIEVFDFITFILSSLFSSICCNFCDFIGGDKIEDDGEYCVSSLGGDSERMLL